MWLLNHAGPGDHGSVVMTEAAAGELCRLFDERGLRCWVVGGWGVDALLGRWTREHKDLDVLLAVSEHAQAWRLLHDRGYLLAYRWEENVDVPGDFLPGGVQPTAYVLEDPSGQQVDVHVLDDRTRDLRPLWSSDHTLIAGALDAEGTIDGVRVRCMSARMQLVAHEGYELPEAHQADVVELRRLLRTTMHDGEIETDVSLVRRLLAGQFPQWADLPIDPVESYGTDHDIYRLGAELAARLPRIGWATDQAAKEAEWLPKLAPHLPLAVPSPVTRGHPDLGYPFEWSVYEWLPGENANGTIDDLDRAAVDLAEFVRALRRVDTTGAHPRPPGGRGGPHAEQDEHVRRSIAELGDRIDGAATLRSWDESLEASADWRGDEVWVHGDLLPGNLLVVNGRLSAVIDFGGLNVGDPACDLQPAWNVFAGDNRRRFLTLLEADDSCWLRGRGWALAQAVSGLAYYWHTNPGMVRQTSHALTQVLADS
jgi:aminoglycoside phosphotransferase (APT) family kinase protein